MVSDRVTSEAVPSPPSSLHPRETPAQLPVRISRTVSNIEPFVSKANMPVEGAVHENVASGPPALDPHVVSWSEGAPAVLPEATESPIIIPRSVPGHIPMGGASGRASVPPSRPTSGCPPLSGPPSTPTSLPASPGPPSRVPESTSASEPPSPIEASVTKLSPAPESTGARSSSPQASNTSREVSST